MRLDFLFEKSVEMCRKKLNGETKDTMMKITRWRFKNGFGKIHQAAAAFYIHNQN